MPNGSRSTMYSIADQVSLISDMVRRRTSDKDFSKFLSNSRLLINTGRENLEISMTKALSMSNSIKSESGLPRTINAQIRKGLDTAAKDVSKTSKAFDRVGLSMASFSGMESVYLALNNKEYMGIMTQYFGKSSNQVIFDSNVDTGTHKSSGASRMLFIGNECKNPQDMMASSYLMSYLNKEIPSMDALSKVHGPQKAEDINQHALGASILECSAVMDILDKQTRGRENTCTLITASDHAAIKEGISITQGIESPKEYESAIIQMIQVVAKGHVQRKVSEELDISP
ncbi:MAG: hypothetical protein RPS47_04770 [Colwellia sp.]